MEDEMCDMKTLLEEEEEVISALTVQISEAKDKRSRLRAEGHDIESSLDQTYLRLSPEPCRSDSEHVPLAVVSSISYSLTGAALSSQRLYSTEHG